MRRQLFHIKDRQAMRRKNLLGGHKAKIGKVLVIDGVKLIFRHQAHQMRKLYRDHALRLE